MAEENYTQQARKLLRSKPDLLNCKQDNGLVKALRKCCFVPQRYVFGIMGLFGLCNAYTMRVCLNLAITQMVNHTKQESITVDPDACPSDDLIIGNVTVYDENLTIIENSYAIFHWSEETQGFILSSFYYGYASTQVLGGFLSERYGAKWVFSGGLLSTAVFTILTPITVNWGGARWLVVLRVLQGMGEGPSCPALMAMMARWVPPHERSFQGALIFGGAHVGNIFGSFVSGILLSGGRDWAYVFYVFGGFGLIWFLFWAALCFSTPITHPYISEKEQAYLNSKVKNADGKMNKDPVPWKPILRSKAVWALVFASIGHDWGYYVMVSDLPKYSHDVLKFNIGATGSLTALPYLCLWISSFLFGFVCEYCIKKGWHSIKTGRLIHTSIATTGPGVCIVLASYAGCDRNAAMICFIMSMALMGGYYCGMKVHTLDIAPNYAGTVTSITNTTSTFAGVIAPYLIGLLTPDSTLAEWRVVFWLCFVILVATNAIYVYWSGGEQQWWDDIKKYGYPPGWEAKHGAYTFNFTACPEIKLEDSSHNTDKKMNQDLIEHRINKESIGVPSYYTQTPKQN